MPVTSMTGDEMAPPFGVEAGSSFFKCQSIDVAQVHGPLLHLQRQIQGAGADVFVAEGEFGSRQSRRGVRFEKMER